LVEKDEADAKVSYSVWPGQQEVVAMKKLINRPQEVVEEMVEGLVAVYPALRRLPGHTVLIRSDPPDPTERPIAVISGAAAATSRLTRATLDEPCRFGTCFPLRVWQGYDVHGETLWAVSHEDSFNLVRSTLACWIARSVWRCWRKR
jgi:hypothetical protein